MLNNKISNHKCYITKSLNRKNLYIEKEQTIDCETIKPLFTNFSLLPNIDWGAGKSTKPICFP